METLNAYFDRKHEEISLLNACLHQPFRLRAAKTVTAIVEQKFQLAAALKAQEARDHWAFTETAWAAETEHRSGPLRFRYDYQRAGLEVAGPPIYEALGSVPPDYFQRSIYTSSGMTAISALLVALERLNKPVDVIAFPATYSETVELIENYSRNLRLQWFPNWRRSDSKSSNFKALWLDCCIGSAAFKDVLSSSAHSFDLILFDTTGLWVGSGRIRRLLSWAIEAGVPIILLRSHTKLDSLGVEYGRLGSMVFVGEPRRELAKDTSLECIANQAANAIRLFGGTTLPAHFPPFIGNDDYASLSQRRLVAMLRNSRRIRKRLRILMPSAELDFVHALCVVLVPDNMLSEQEAKDLAKSMCRDLRAIGIPIHHAGSFGFDFAAAESFRDASHDRFDDDAHTFRRSPCPSRSVLARRCAACRPHSMQRSTSTGAHASGSELPLQVLGMRAIHAEAQCRAALGALEPSVNRIGDNHSNGGICCSSPIALTRRLGTRYVQRNRLHDMAVQVAGAASAGQGCGARSANRNRNHPLVENQRGYPPFTYSRTSEYISPACSCADLAYVCKYDDVAAPLHNRL